jgi:hypothetical protein
VLDDSSVDMNRSPEGERESLRNIECGHSEDEQQQRGSKDSPQSSAGCLIINADDWGLDTHTTDMILECVLHGAVSSVSAMVFMSDSERAADIASERHVDTGLHLNFTTPFTRRTCPTALVERHNQVARFLRRHRFAQVVFHPGLARAFEYVVDAQIDEYRNRYGRDPMRLDGHHHMHLCSNVLFQQLLPPGTVVRRNFSFLSSEKHAWNRTYRRVVDWELKRRHRLVDFLFNLVPFDCPSRLTRIMSLATRSRVELETHPSRPGERAFLLAGLSQFPELDIQSFRSAFSH